MSPLRAFTHSSLVRLGTGWPEMARIWSPSATPPQLQAARAAGECGLQHCGHKVRFLCLFQILSRVTWIYSRRTHSLARPPPSNLRPKPSFSPGRRAMVISSSVKSQAGSASWSRHWMAMSLVVAGRPGPGDSEASHHCCVVTKCLPGGVAEVSGAAPAATAARAWEAGPYGPPDSAYSFSVRLLRVNIQYTVYRLVVVLESTHKITFIILAAQ